MQFPGLTFENLFHNCLANGSRSAEDKKRGLAYLRYELVV